MDGICVRFYRSVVIVSASFLSVPSFFLYLDCCCEVLHYCASNMPNCFRNVSVNLPPFSLFLFYCFPSVSVPTGMNGKSILSAMARLTPEHSSVMSAAGSGATTSPCSSRSSSQRSGTGAHTPGGPHRSPCTQAKSSEGSSSNALTPSAGPARCSVSPKLSPGEVGCTMVGFTQHAEHELIFFA